MYEIVIIVNELSFILIPFQVRMGTNWMNILTIDTRLLVLSQLFHTINNYRYLTKRLPLAQHSMICFTHSLSFIAYSCLFFFNHNIEDDLVLVLELHFANKSRLTFFFFFFVQTSSSKSPREAGGDTFSQTISGIYYTQVF